MDNIELFTVYEFDKKIRLGKQSDGGYVIGDLDTKYDCYISAGIECEESFSRDFIYKYDIDKTNSFGFDGTIDDYPVYFTDRITFIKKNINGYNDSNNTNLSFIFEKYDNIFIKMDIEGGEYDWLTYIDKQQLNKISQMVIEFHGLTFITNRKYYDQKIICIKKLLETHYVIHAHGNNCGNVVNCFPDIIELTFVNKKYFDKPPNKNTHTLPTSNLDFPNGTRSPDINLNFYPFVYNNKEYIKTIFFCNKTLDKMDFCASKWKQLNPDYEIKLYDEKLCEKFLLEEFDEKYVQIFKFLKDDPVKFDFWKICVLYKYGGTYADIDIEPLVPIDEFIEKQADFVTCYTNEQIKKFKSHFIISRKNNIILEKCIKWYLDKFNENKQYSYNDWCLTTYFDVLKINNNEGIHIFSGLTIQMLYEYIENNNIHDAHVLYKENRIFNCKYETHDNVKHEFSKNDKIPNIIHFCYGMCEQKEEFLLAHLLAITSAYYVNKPKKIYLHYHYEPYGKWWDIAKKYIELHKVDIPKDFGAYKTSHIMDIIKMKILLEYGGIYIDINTITIRPYIELLNKKMILGIIKHENEIKGLCNTVIIANKDSIFLQKWWKIYSQIFEPEGWDETSLILPFAIYSHNTYDLTILSEKTFYEPCYNNIEKIFCDESCNINNELIILNLWETFSINHLKNIKRYFTSKCLYGKILLHLLNTNHGFRGLFNYILEKLND